MKTLMVSAAALVSLVGSASAAVGVVRAGSVTMTQTSATRLVSIAYVLDDAPAVVTVDVQTNAVPDAAEGWISIGDVHLKTLAGAVNRKVVNSSEPQKVTWRPQRDWPEGGVFLDNRVRAVVKAWPLDTPPPYMVVDLKASLAPRYYVSPAAFPSTYANPIPDDPQYKEDYMVFRRIPAASVTWRMGAVSDDTHANAVNEKPHMVTLSEDYYIGVYPVTQKQYVNIFDNATGCLPGQPAAQAENNADWQKVVSVSYETIRGKVSDSPKVDWPNTDMTVVTTTSVLGKLRAKAAGYLFDLPTDAQWEYAYRAGEGAPFYSGSYTSMSDIGWLNNIYAVGQKTPNVWGVYDICGNGFEWCRDWYKADYSDGSDISDPPGPTSGSNRSVRNGPWTWNTRASDRAFSFAPATVLNHTGFRVMCPALVP